jgi:predicted DNA-binding protein with PD1-like motif
MHYTQRERIYVLRIERGEEVIKTITDLCKREGVANAFFRGIGAVEGLTCGYYALTEKEYHFTHYAEMVEVASLTGNITLKDGEPFVHAHGVFTNTKNEAFGGHIKEMVSGIVVEIVLEVLDSNIERVHDDATGLFLMRCENEF